VNFGREFGHGPGSNSLFFALNDQNTANKSGTSVGISSGAISAPGGQLVQATRNIPDGRGPVKSALAGSCKPVIINRRSGYGPFPKRVLSSR
jgi:hypothetical protein